MQESKKIPLGYMGEVYNKKGYKYFKGKLVEEAAEQFGYSYIVMLRRVDERGQLYWELSGQQWSTNHE